VNKMLFKFEDLTDDECDNFTHHALRVYLEYKYTNKNLWKNHIRSLYPVSADTVSTIVQRTIRRHIGQNSTYWAYFQYEGGTFWLHYVLDNVKHAIMILESEAKKEVCGMKCDKTLLNHVRRYLELIEVSVTGGDFEELMKTLEREIDSVKERTGRSIHRITINRIIDSFVVRRLPDDKTNEYSLLGHLRIPKMHDGHRHVDVHIVPTATKPSNGSEPHSDYHRMTWPEYRDADQVKRAKYRALKRNITVPEKPDKHLSGINGVKMQCHKGDVFSFSGGPRPWVYSVNSYGWLGAFKLSIDACVDHDYDIVEDELEKQMMSVIKNYSVKWPKLKTQKLLKEIKAESKLITAAVKAGELQ